MPRTYRPVAWTTRPCIVCRRPFTAKRRDARVCSPACHAKAHRLRYPK